MTPTQTTQPLTVAVSVADVTRRVLAISALQAVTDTSTPMPPLLLPGHAKALAEAARQAFNIIALQLGPRVAAVDLADGDILTLTLHPGVAIPAAGIAEPLAAAMASRVLAIAMSGHDGNRAAAAAADADAIVSRLMPARCVARASYGSVAT